jgi:hypothetical protein
MNLAVVFHPPLPGGRIQAGKLGSPEKDPPSRGRAFVCLLGKVCAREVDRPPGATYYAQTTGDSVGAPGTTMHFIELHDILFRQPGRHHRTRAGPAWLRRMVGHRGETMVTSGGIIVSAPYTKKKGISPRGSA